MFNKKGLLKSYNGFFRKNKLLMAIATLVGTIVGAGMLGIPYVVAKTGFLLGFIIMILLGVSFIFVNLFVGEFVLRTKEQHQLTGYAEKYLGKWGKRAMAFAMLFGIYGALTAYLIGEGKILQTIFGFGPPLIYSLIFFVITFLIIYSGIKATGKTEMIMVFLLLLVVAVIGLFSFKHINFNHFLSFDLKHVFLSYGVIVFAYLGAASIPEIQEELGQNKKLMKKAIVFGSIVPIFLYLLFCFFVIGIVGLENFELLKANERIATIALSMYSSSIMGFLANIVAVLAMFTSYLTLGMALIEIYHFDYRLSRKISFLLTLSFPIIILLLDLTSFIAVLGITGAVAGGIEGITIVLTYWKAKYLGNRKPEYSIKRYKLISIILMIMFIFGLIYQIFKMI